MADDSLSVHDGYGAIRLTVRIYEAHEPDLYEFVAGLSRREVNRLAEAAFKSAMLAQPDYAAFIAGRRGVERTAPSIGGTTKRKARVAKASDQPLPPVGTDSEEVAGPISPPAVERKALPPPAPEWFGFKGLQG